MSILATWMPLISFGVIVVVKLDLGFAVYMKGGVG
jgi:hypothetical protein